MKKCGILCVLGKGFLQVLLQTAGFPKGKKHDKLNALTWDSHLAFPRNNLELRQDACYYCFLEPLVMFLCNDRVSKCRETMDLVLGFSCIQNLNGSKNAYR